MKYNQLAEKLNITKNDYEHICKALGHEPNELETFLFSAMWSEHCGYRHSKPYIQSLYKKGAVLTSENAGGVKIKDHMFVFKMESHNHPCAVEPYNGAATGVGGIIRDILAMGAKPIALLNSLKFGELDTNKAKHTTDEVIRGISDYANCIGVPTISGETIFSKEFKYNPLVNVMALGLVHKDNVITSKAQKDDILVLLGNPTRRDGTGGASFASKEFESSDTKDRLSIQIADPFVKNKLIKATLEIFETGIAKTCQDCGAAGILSSTSEIAYRSKLGVELELTNIHSGEFLMENYEIMLSETQERMVFAISEKKLQKFKKIAKKHELEYSVIGKLSKDKKYSLKENSKTVACLPVNLLTCPPTKKVPAIKPKYLKQLKPYAAKRDINIAANIYELTKDPNFASKQWVYSQFDYSVGAKTAIPPQNGGASALWIKEQGIFIGIATDSNPLKTYIDPYLGTANTLLASYRKLVAQGFEPIGYTNCLNFANPENPEVMYQFEKTIEAMNKFSQSLKIPAVSGNVSLYNETNGYKIPPTPVFAMLGKSTDKPSHNNISAGNETYLIGNIKPKHFQYGGSAYFNNLYNEIGNKVCDIDLEIEKSLKTIIHKLIAKKLITACMPVGDYGIFGTLVKLLEPHKLGFVTRKKTVYNREKELFAEINGQYIITTKASVALEEFLQKQKIEYKKLGRTTKENILDLYGTKINAKDIYNNYENCLSNIMNETNKK